jgi:hypothetical protein
MPGTHRVLSLVVARFLKKDGTQLQLKRAVAEGKVRKVAKPVRYVAVSDSMPMFTEKSKA